MKSTPSARVRAFAQEMADECLASRARMLGRVVSGVYQEELESLGLTVAQVNMLTALVLAGRMSPAALSARLRLEKSTISRNLRLMIDHRWVAGEGRGRGLMLSPTEEGVRLYEAAYPAWQRAQRRARALLGSQGTKTLALLASALVER